MVPRMRTINQCAEIFKEQDPETKITKNYIRTLVVDGKIPYVECGKKYLINLDKLIEFLSGPQQEEKEEEKPKKKPKGYKIRRLVI